MNVQPVILSGGSGTRLWPLSREHFPKQLLALNGELTMLQATVSRLDGLAGGSDGVAVNAPILVCNEEHRFLVAEQVRQLTGACGSIILEPEGRNTAPALTLAALAAADRDGDDIVLVMPADHVIQDTPAFHDAVRRGVKAAAAGYLVTFGIVPTAPETGYGYIKQGPSAAGGEAFAIDKFVEKPDPDTAQQYVAAGDYLWNSGMFMMRASAWLDAIERHRADIAAACRTAYTQGKSDRDFYRVDKTAFAACPSDSIDYAVMEKVAGPGEIHQGVVIPLAAGWSDVGAWPALWEISDRDGEGNVFRGDIYALHTENTLAISQSRLVAALGLKDMIVVETPDAVLVAHKDHAQDIKKIVSQLKTENRSQYQTHRRVYRPWGSYEGIDVGDRFQVKRITVNPGASLSLQMHHHRAEHWIVVRGTAKVTRGDDVTLITENQSTYIPLGVRHRLENPGSIPLDIIEVQSGSYLGEDDIVRFEDVYGR